MTTLDDASAIYILKTIAEARLRSGTPDVIQATEIRAELAAAFGNPSSIPVSEGDLARAALDLLAQDPAFAEPIKMMAREGAPASGQRYIDPGTIALTTAALLVLQTRVKFKRDSKGKWSFEMEKKASGDGAVKLLVQRLVSLLGQ